MFAYTFVILPCHFLILSADGHRWVEAIFVGWLASATILDKALEAWHHDASTGFCFDCCLLRLLNVAKVAKTAKISDRPSVLSTRTSNLDPPSQVHVRSVELCSKTQRR